MSSRLELPAQIGGYVAEALLGEGGMGIVYRGRAPDGRPVAIKVLHGRSAGPEGHARFLQESALRIEHENVVHVLDAGTTERGPYLVQELLQGEPLDAKLEPAPLSWRAAVDLGIQVCRGLEAVHARGVVHRDLKPANLFVTQAGTIKVLDFGIARVTTRETRMTAGGLVIGTPSYLAPEQARGELDVDGRLDVWALGVVLYEAMTGVRPFERPSAYASLVAVLFETPRRLCEVDARIPVDVSEVVQRCLAKPKGERWQQAADLRRALEGLAPVETADAPEPSLQRSIRPGEQRLVAVLLAVGVTDTSAVRAAVEAHRGVFSPLVGGRAVGLFGADRWVGDEPAQATSAALDCRPAAASVAVALGRATSRDGWVSGGAMAHAEAGVAAALDGVALDHDTAKLVEDTFHLRRVSDDLHEVLSARVDSRAPTSRSSRTIGRDIELAQIELALHSVTDEHRATVVLVIGLPGSGKSQLVTDAHRMAVAAGFDGAVLSARSRPGHEDVSLSLLRATFSRHAEALHAEGRIGRISSDAPDEERRQAVRELARAALRSDAVVREAAVFLGELLGVPMPETPALRAARADPQLMGDRLRLTVQEHVDGLLDHGPLALFLEDLHWADAASLSLLDELAGRRSDAPLLLMGTARPELDDRMPMLFGRHQTLSVLRVPLRPLSAAAVRALAELVAGRSLAPELVALLVAKVAGNPLFVTQIVAHMDEAGTLDSPPSRLPVPVSVEAAVQSRLDHVSPYERDAVQSTAVLARAVTAQELTTLGCIDAQATLGALARREIFVRSRGPAGVGAYQFASSVAMEVAYRMIDGPRAIELHARVGDHLAASARGVQATGPGTDAEEIAGHFERGQRPLDAARWYAGAALDAGARGDSGQALRTSEKALALGVVPESRFELHMVRADALRFGGRREEQSVELDRALERAASPAERARVLIERAALLARLGRTAEASEVAERAVSEAEASGDGLLVALAEGRHAEVLIDLGRYADAEAALDAGASLVEDDQPRVLALIAGWRARLAGGRGDLGRARSEWENASRSLLAVGDLRRAAAVEVNLADLHNRVGDHRTALEALARALVSVRRVGHRPLEGYLLLNEAYAKTRLGDAAGALVAIELARALAEELRDARMGLFARLYAARALLVGGDFDRAFTVASEVAESARGSGHATPRALALSLAAQAALHADRPANAVECSTKALAIRDELGGIEESEAEIFLVHARALAAVGRAEDAAAISARGRARLHELAGRITEPGWRTRFLAGLPEHRALLEGSTAGDVG